MGKFPAAAPEVVASAARTTSGNSGALPSDSISVLNLLVDVTAIGGTPTLDPTVEWSHDGVAFFPSDPPDAMAQLTAVSRAVKRFDVKGPQYRIVWTIGGGTPSLTFSVNRYADLGRVE